jgi:hypothetical protein
MFSNPKNNITKYVISHYKSRIIYFLAIIVIFQINGILFPSFAADNTILILGEELGMFSNPSSGLSEDCLNLINNREAFEDCVIQEGLGGIYPPSFSPAYLCSKENTPITWTNNDDVTHSIIFTKLETFNSGVINPSENFTRIFNNPGNFSYFDETNPNMEGRITIVSNEKDCEYPVGSNITSRIGK